ncbi:MAG: MFS transporter [Myxococcales bacterium]|nr:MFS transporter [Myxococcales bacterium]
MAASASPVDHTFEFRLRRFWNWFPMGLTYALLYMGRYNLTVAQTSLGKTQLMTKEDFGLIFGAGTIVYAFAFLFNGPLIDRIGGKRGMLLAAFGAAAANFGMGVYLRDVLAAGAKACGGGGETSIAMTFSVLYAANMYFQSFGAVSIVKVNAHWFHVRERGGFSGIFGTMISSGIFLAFTVNGWLLELVEKSWGDRVQWVVFVAPAALLFVFGIVEVFLLRDRPAQAGLKDFDTGDASSGDTSQTPVPTKEIFKRLFTNPIILTVAFIEFCTGVLRNGVMHWFPIYAKEVWVLPKSHLLMQGSWDRVWLILVMFAVAAVSFLLARQVQGQRRGYLIVFGSLAFLAPFFQGGWGGILMVAGVIGGNVAGWVSDLFFQSRRGPTAAGLYGFLTLCSVGMIFVLSAPPAQVAEMAPVPEGKPEPAATARLLVGDKIVSIAGKKVDEWADVTSAVACWPAACECSGWDPEQCKCSAKLPQTPDPEKKTIPATVERDGKTVELELIDPKAKMRAGDKRLLAERPVLPMSPYWMGLIVFLISLCVIGTHGVLSGTATMDFGGRKAAATAVGMIDGFVYLGTALQSISLGFLTSSERYGWGWWPPFLVPFAVGGFLLCLRIWNAKPGKGGGH